jgi:hypothetical protein
MPAVPSARSAYRRWYAAAGPWAGFFRAVPLVALARGVISPPTHTTESPEGLIATLGQAGRQEGWLGREDVLLVLDLPGATGVATVAGLAQWGVRPVLLSLLWPEPEALLPADALLAALLRHAPGRPRGGRLADADYQYAFVLGRERATPASPAALAVRFDNRYDLGTVDLPSAARLSAGGVGAVVACRLADMPPAGDLAAYVDGLEAAGVPIRRLAID